MTEPSQYFKGRTVQEQMNEVISYVDARSTEVATDVAAAKASEVLEPAEAAKDAAQAAQEAAEDAQTAAETAKAGAEAARDTTLAALPQVQSDIDALEGRMDTVELKVTTAEGNIITIQGRVTAVETKNSQQDTAIAALQTADAQNVKINSINNYAIGLSGNQVFSGLKTATEFYRKQMSVNPDETHTADIQNFVQIVSPDRLTVYGYIYFKLLEDNQTQWVIGLRNRDGTAKEQSLITSD